MQTITTCLMLIALSVCAANAQSHKFINVFKVAFNEPELENAPRVKEFTFGEPIVLSLRSSARVPRTFHARFFHGTVSALIENARARTDREGCVWFDTQVIGARAGSTISFDTPLSEYWLYPSGRGFSAQIYTIVFEAGDEPLDPMIRLTYQDLRGTYFANAIQIKLKPGSRETANQAVVEQVQQEQEEQREKSAQRYRITLQHPSESPCWSSKYLAQQRGTRHPSVLRAARLEVQQCQPLSDGAKIPESMPAEVIE